MNGLRAFFLSLGLILLSTATSLQADVVQAVVHATSGLVEYAPPGSSIFLPLAANQKLDEGSTVRTGSNGTAVISTTPGTAIQVGNNSLVVLSSLAFAKSGNLVTQRKAHLDLTTGSISALIDPTTPQATDFQVITPEGAAAARGTFFAVLVKDGKTYVGVKEGKVGATASGSK